jgi:hypothetical protein
LFPHVFQGKYFNIFSSLLFNLLTSKILFEGNPP